jgi:hypothetical protein
MTPHRFLLGFAVLSLSVLVTAVEINAQSKFGSQGGQDRAANGIVRMQKRPHQRIAKRLGLQVNAISSSRNAKLARLASRCVCNAPDESELDAYGGCFRNCLKAYGVSLTSIGACGAACTGNLVGCAVCAGVQEWIILGCGQYCAWRNVFSSDGGAISRGRPRPRNARATDQARV